MTKVLIVICKNRPMETKPMRCLTDALRYPYKDIELEWTAGEESLLLRSRSAMATAFLDQWTDYDIFLFIDDDVTYGQQIPGSFRVDSHKAIEYVVESCLQTKSIVGGLYSIKCDTGPQAGRICCVGIDNGEAYHNVTIGPGGGLVEVKWTGTGFLAFPRHVLQGMAAKTEKVNMYGEGNNNYPFFMPFFHKGTMLSEDYAGCERARESGYKIWADSRIILGHVGLKEYFPCGT
jgi:hypothetical protein